MSIRTVSCKGRIGQIFAKSDFGAGFRAFYGSKIANPGVLHGWIEYGRTGALSIERVRPQSALTSVPRDFWSRWVVS